VYKFIKNADKKKNVSKDYIDSVEKKYNIRFPKILREYYLNYNYSNEKKCVFFIEGCSEEFELDIILPLKYGTEPMEQAYEYILRADEVSNDFIPFARDIDNGKYYWNRTNGKVYYFTHDVEIPLLVCQSVDEYFEILNNCCDKKITIPNLGNIFLPAAYPELGKIKFKDIISLIVAFWPIILIILFVIIFNVLK